MAILKWKRASYPEASSELDPLNFLNRFQEDWDRFFGWKGFPETAGLFDRSDSPAVDVVETEEDCTVWAEIPGLDRKDIELSIAANVLTLKGEKKDPSKDKKDRDRLYRDETWTGTFQRSLSLPDSIDPDKATAEFRDGVLKVTMKKKAEHKPRQIPVAVR
jgi:HSP20 family protein